jgi:hypothetical protein
MSSMKIGSYCIKMITDFAPDHMTPTWRNGRTGSNSISKRLDRFLISEHYISPEEKIRSWVSLPYLSDHASIILQLSSSTRKIAYPFKLNAGWLTETDFNTIVLMSGQTHNSHQNRASNIDWYGSSKLKARIKSWAYTFRQQNAHRLLTLDTEIRAIILAEASTGTTRDGCHLLKDLELERNQLLIKDEMTWRQRCRTSWLKSGDLNTKKIHKYASSCRNKNSIWEITTKDGTLHTGQPALKSAAVNYFQPFFEQNPTANLQSSVSVARLFPHSVTREDALQLDKPCTLQEISAALKSFSKDKSPGPDGWTVEFYLHFFDLVGQDLLELVEDTRLNGKVIGTINSTFLTLIPKAASPTTFGDYRPISLCNLCYKLISKVIASRIKPILSRFLSKEQLGFLKGRQILDAIGTAQECLHNIKIKKSKALILKLDLKKAFDCIDWDFLRLILVQTGFSQTLIKWIMGCVVSANLAILVNGEPSSFFAWAKV